MSQLKLLCTDLDRTLLPNGDQSESPGVRAQLAQTLHKHNIPLAFVSGRDHGLVMQAITQFDLPLPQFVIADVGSTLYHCDDEHWQCVDAWHKHIGVDWQFSQGQQLFETLSGINELKLQEPAKQGRYKLSFYTPLDWNAKLRTPDIQQQLAAHGYRTNLIFSVDDEREVGLLDIVPASAGKLPAIRYLLHQLALAADNVLFAGDSGNDLDVLCSELPAVLVANAADDVRQQALQQSCTAGTEPRLYLASGVVGNGCYAAGILEGIRHFFPSVWNSPQ